MDVSEDLASRLPEISARNGVQLVALYELMSTKKVVSVPNNATAHIRGSRVNVLVMATWTDKDTNKLDAARSGTSELSRILIQSDKVIPESVNTGYANYSER